MLLFIYFAVDIEKRPRALFLSYIAEKTGIYIHFQLSVHLQILTMKIWTYLAHILTHMRNIGEIKVSIISWRHQHHFSAHTIIWSYSLAFKSILQLRVWAYRKIPKAPKQHAKEARQRDAWAAQNINRGKYFVKLRSEMDRKDSLSLPILRKNTLSRLTRF